MTEGIIPGSQMEVDEKNLWLYQSPDSSQCRLLLLGHTGPQKVLLALFDLGVKTRTGIEFTVWSSIV